MTVKTNHGACNCKKCTEFAEREQQKRIEEGRDYYYYPFTQKLMDEHNQMKDDIKELKKRINELSHIVL